MIEHDIYDLKIALELNDLYNKALNKPNYTYDLDLDTLFKNTDRLKLVKEFSCSLFRQDYVLDRSMSLSQMYDEVMQKLNRTPVITGLSTNLTYSKSDNALVITIYYNNGHIINFYKNMK